MKFRTLTIVDIFSKEALAMEVGQRLRSEHVVAALNRLAAHRGPPQYLFVDNVLNQKSSWSYGQSVPDWQIAGF
jgi:transposase InsO family protein